MEIAESISMPKGRSYILIIDTDSYSGNFERQLGGYAAGAYEPHMHHGEREARLFVDDLTDAGQEDLAASITEKRISALHEEYGPVAATIWPTPGRRNDGMGAHYDEGDRRLKGATWPAYESVAVFFNQLLTPEEFALVERRAREYCSVNRIGFKGIRIIEAIVEEPRFTDVTRIFA